MNEGSTWTNITYIELFDLIMEIKGNFNKEVK